MDLKYLVNSTERPNKNYSPGTPPADNPLKLKTRTSSTDSHQSFLPLTPDEDTRIAEPSQHDHAHLHSPLQTQHESAVSANSPVMNSNSNIVYAPVCRQIHPPQPLNILAQPEHVQSPSVQRCTSTRTSVDSDCKSMSAFSEDQTKFLIQQSPELPSFKSPQHLDHPYPTQASSSTPSVPKITNWAFPHCDAGLRLPWDPRHRELPYHFYPGFYQVPVETSPHRLLEGIHGAPDMQRVQQVQGPQGLPSDNHNHPPDSSRPGSYYRQMEPTDLPSEGSQSVYTYDMSPLKTSTPELRRRPQTATPIQQVKDHILVLEPTHSTVSSSGNRSKQYKCQDCGRIFFRKSDLVRHIQIHLGIKPNVCKFCGKKFIQRSALTVHNRVHTGEKPYKCQVCSRAFSDSSSLARHRRIHNRKTGLSVKEKETDDQLDEPSNDGIPNKV